MIIFTLSEQSDRDKLFGKVLQSKSLSNKKTNNDNILLRVSKASEEIFGQVLLSKRLRGIKTELKQQKILTKNKYNLLLQASKEIYLFEAYCLKGISELHMY